MIFEIKKIKKTIIFTNLVIMIFLISGCSNRNEEQILKEKVIQELEYLDTKIVGMLNSLNNISFENYTVKSREVNLDGSQGNVTKNTEEAANSNEDSADRTEITSNSINVTRMEPNTILVTDSNDIDWVSLKQEIELLNSSWTAIILDLHSMELSNDEILAFSTILDKCILSIRDESKADTLVNLAELYTFIPTYLSGIPGENSRKNVKQIKSYIINSYALLEQNNWTEITGNIREAESIFKTIMMDVEYIKNRGYKVNQTYVMLKELEKSSDIQDHELFYIKYKNVMESLTVM